MLVTAISSGDEEDGEIVLEKGDPALYDKSFLPDEADEPVAVG